MSSLSWSGSRATELLSESLRRLFLQGYPVFYGLIVKVMLLGGLVPAAFVASREIVYVPCKAEVSPEITPVVGFSSILGWSGKKPSESK